MADKLSLSLDDMISSQPKKAGKGGGGAGGKAGKVSKIRVREGAQPYQRPKPSGKGGGGGGRGGGPTLESLSAASAAKKGGGGGGRAAPVVQGLTTGTKVKVSNLDHGVTGEDVQELFGEVGPLKAAQLITGPNGASKGVAIVTFVRKADAETAIEQYNGVPLDGRPLSISIIGGASLGVAAAAAAAKTSAAAANASAFQVVAGGRGAGRTVTVDEGVDGHWVRGQVRQPAPSRAGGKGEGGGRGKGGGRGRGGGKGGGRGKGKGGGSKPVSMDDLDAELDSYHAAAE